MEMSLGPGVTAEVPDQLEPVHARHHHVGQDQVQGLGQGGGHCRLSVAGEQHLEARCRQLHLEQARQRRLVLHDQDAAAELARSGFLGTHPA